MDPEEQLLTKRPDQSVFLMNFYWKNRGERPFESKKSQVIAEQKSQNLAAKLAVL